MQPRPFCSPAIEIPGRGYAFVGHQGTRSFLASAGVATAVGLVAPRKLFAQDDGLVQTARRTAGASTVTVQKLRGNTSVLMGAGGNIAVLTGRDGKLLVDAGFAGARPKIMQSLLPPQTLTGATAFGVLKTSSETFSRAFDVIAARQLHFTEGTHNDC